LDRTVVAGRALALAVCIGAAAGAAFDARALQEAPVSVSRPVPVDAYADEGIAGLIERALAQRKARAEGLTSFETTFRERIYAGLGGAALRRERAMFHQERAARLRWAAEGEHIIRWLGLRRGVPIVGLGVEFEDDLRDDDAFELDFDIIDPASEHLALGSEWALHPLADTAAYHYRYRSGDTLRIRFPGDNREVTLIEAVIEPREARFDRIAGSFWFDADEGVLSLDDATVLRIPPFTEIGTPVQLIRAFGGRDAFVAAVHDLQSALYREAA
jgi:hypothetical protein